MNRFMKVRLLQIMEIEIKKRRKLENNESSSNFSNDGQSAESTRDI